MVKRGDKLEARRARQNKGAGKGRLLCSPGESADAMGGGWLPGGREAKVLR